MAIEFIDPFQSWKQFQISAAPEPGGNACITLIETGQPDIEVCGGGTSGFPLPFTIATLHFPKDDPCTKLYNPPGNLTDTAIQAYRFKNLRTGERIILPPWGCGTNQCFQAQGLMGCPTDPDGFCEYDAPTVSHIRACRIEQTPGNWAVEYQLATPDAINPDWQLGDPYEVLFGYCPAALPDSGLFDQTGGGTGIINPAPGCGTTACINADEEWNFSKSDFPASPSQGDYDCLQSRFIGSISDETVDFALAPIHIIPADTSESCELSPGVWGRIIIDGTNVTWILQYCYADGAASPSWAGGEIPLPQA